MQHRLNEYALTLSLIGATAYFVSGHKTAIFP
jgi:hypothetical protein